jgi:tripartite ATP-independent transporter DctM subunit
MSQTEVAIILLVGSFLLFIIGRLPIAIALGTSAMITVLYLGFPVRVVVQSMVSGINKVALLAIPFFIFAGQIMSDGGISNRLVSLSKVIVGRFRGGLAMVNILTSMFFGGISGSSVADTSSIGTILIPEMVKDGYDADFSASVTITSSIQGILIPPSHNMIIYSMAAGGLSVGALFMAGVVPGILLGISQMILSYSIAVKRGYPKGDKIGVRAALKISREAFLGLLTPVIIIGGVLGGIFTATESAAVAALWAFIVTMFIYKEIDFKKFKQILMSTLMTLVVVMPVIAAANAFGYLLAYLKVPQLVLDGLLGITSNKYLLLLLVNVILLILGMIMDMAPLILICTPVFLPLVQTLGMSPIHFGIIMLLNLGIGLLTPPVGVTLFVGSTISKVSIEKLFKSTLPFYVSMIVLLLLMTYIEPIVMWLPRLVM